MRIIVMGLGINRGGVGVTKWLMSHGAKVLVTDLKTEKELADSVADLERHYISASRKLGKGKVHRPEYVFGAHRESDLKGADMLIRNPAVPRTASFLKAAKKMGIRIESDISLFFRMMPHPIIGITGSKGKTTVTMLLGEMLKRQFGRTVVAGNFGKSALDSLDALRRAKKVPPVLLELSSWALESLKDVKRSPNVSVLTNLFPEHLDRYDDMEDYAAAKELIFAFQDEEGLAFVPSTPPLAKEMGKRVAGRRIWIAKKAPQGDANALYFDGQKAILRTDGAETVLFHASDLKIPGEHTLMNALIAAGVAHAYGVNLRTIRTTVKSFKGVPHRLEKVKEARGISWWNDSAATHPEASIAALESLSHQKNVILIAGGSDKKLDFASWAKAVKRYAREVILLDGTATKKVVEALAKVGVKPSAKVKSMTSAVLRANVAARTRDVVLLSPGATSFGLFKNEFDRGDRFRKAVGRYAR